MNFDELFKKHKSGGVAKDSRPRGGLNRRKLDLGRNRLGGRKPFFANEKAKTNVFSYDKPRMQNKNGLSSNFKKIFPSVSDRYSKDRDEERYSKLEMEGGDDEGFFAARPKTKKDEFVEKLSFFDKIATMKKIDDEKKKKEREMREEKERLFRKSRKPEPLVQKKLTQILPQNSQFSYREIKRNRGPTFMSEEYNETSIVTEAIQSKILKAQAMKREEVMRRNEENRQKSLLERKRFSKKLKIQLEEKKKREEEERKKKILEKKKREQDKKRRIYQLMHDKDKRRRALEQSQRIEIRKDLNANINTESVNFQKDVTYLLRKLLSEKYFIQKNEPQPTKIPASFRSADDYLNHFLPCFLQECRHKIKEGLKNSMKDDNREFVEVKLEYLQHESDNLCLFNVEETGKSSPFLYRKNMVVVITNKAFFELQDVNGYKDDFAVLGVLRENPEKTGIPRLVVASEFRKILVSHVRKTQRNSIKLYKVDKMTSEIREFLGLKNLEFDPISKLVYEPKFIASETTKKHNIDFFSNFFKNIKEDFNKGQMKAIQNICLIKQGIKLLQGPPGTGKTHTLLGIASGLYFYMKKNKKNMRKQILICTPSNYAIDEIIMRLLNKGLYGDEGERFTPKIVRLGVTNKIKNPQVLKVCMKNLIEKEMKKINFDNTITEMSKFTERKLAEMNQAVTEEIKLFRSRKGAKEQIEKLRKRKDKIIEEIIRRKRLKMRRKDEVEKLEERILSESEIICCTLNSSGSEKLDRYEHNIEAIIIDEAAQATEPTNIIPFRFKANKVVLIGDPMQLPATTFGKDSNVTGYNKSLFERILDTGIKIEFLYTQYRMVPELREFPSNEFYSGRLKDSSNMALRQFPENLAFLEPNNHLFFNIKSSKEMRSGYSYHNPEEAALCVELVYKLKSAIKGYNVDSVAVISPYKRQVEFLRQKLRDEIDQGLMEVNTVDAFQGQEKDIIIFSCVRSRKDIGFLRDIRRLNVAITRAKYGLFVLGRAETLKFNQTWSNFMYQMNQKSNCVDIQDSFIFQRKLSFLENGYKIPRDKLEIQFKPVVKNSVNNYLGKRSTSMKSDLSPCKFEPSPQKRLKATINKINDATKNAYNNMLRVITSETMSSSSKRHGVQEPNKENSTGQKKEKGGRLQGLISKNAQKRKNKLSQLLSNPSTAPCSVKTKSSMKAKGRLSGLLSSKNTKRTSSKSQKKQNAFDLASISKGFDFYDKMGEEIVKN